MNPEIRSTMVRLGLDPDREIKPEWVSPERVWKREIKQAALQLASDAWFSRDTPGELERAAEVRELTIQQVADDTPSMIRGRIGTEWINHSQTQEWSGSYERGSTELWQAYSEEQLALQVSLTAILDITLAPEERVLIRLIYDAQMTMRQVGNQLSISHVAVQKRLKKVYEKMRVGLELAYGLAPEIIEVTP